MLGENSTNLFEIIPGPDTTFVWTGVLTTIVAADLVGYSGLMAADEEGTIARLKSVRAEVIDPTVSSAGGRIIKSMGDGLLIEFTSPVEAVRSAISIQNVVNGRETGPETHRFRFRVGIHLGDIVEDGDDILGDGVNIAARLESLAVPGGICTSRAIHEQVRGKIDCPMTGLGPQMVKNIPEPVDVWRIDIAGSSQVTTKKAEPSGIAVLPFDNMSSDPEQEFFADGIVEDVITELSRFRSLLVIARNSTFAYKGSAKDIREIAGDLGVRYVVEGSIRRSGDRIRVTAQLIDAETGGHVWAEKWDRVIDDLFAVQDELTAAIVTAVEPELGAHERKLANARALGNLTAWELYHRGVTEHSKFTDEGFAAALVFFEQAIDRDPGFALPYAAYARTAWSLVATGRSAEPSSLIGDGIAKARRALEIDDRQEHAHLGLAVLLSLAGGHEEEALSSSQQAISLNPNNAACYHARAMVEVNSLYPDGYLITQNEREAIRRSPRDPQIFMFHFMAGAGHWVAADYETTSDVLDAYQEACRHHNADWFVFMVTATACINRGMTEEAARYLDKAMERLPTLTLEFYRTSFRHPSWPSWFEKIRDDLEQLVGLGLPRE